MTKFREFSRDQEFLLPPSLHDWLPEDDLAHFVIAACERISLSAFKTNRTNAGKPQYHPQMMLALLIYCYSNGIFSSRRIERATHRDIGVRFVAADQHPDHDTIATFRRENAKAFEAAFLQVLLMARELKLLKVGTVSIDGTKIDANASKIRSVRYDRAQALREKLAGDIAALTAAAEAADVEETPDFQRLPKEIARRQALKDKLDAACARLEAEAAAEHDRAKAEYREKKKAYDAKAGRKGKPPKAPDDDDRQPSGSAQNNLTDPDSALMRKSKHHEYRQSYNPQAVVDADGSQLILATNVATTPTDQPTFAETILAMHDTIGLPETVLADAGFASEHAVNALIDRNIEPLVAITARPPDRPYDFRPPPDAPKPTKTIKAQWRLDMKAKLETDEAQRKYRLRKQTVEPVFGIIKHAIGFRRFHLRGIAKVKNEWNIIAIAYNCKRMANLIPS